MNVRGLSMVKREYMRHGRGTFIAEDGSIYEGYWLFDRMNGAGRKIFKDGSIYVGKWHNNLYEGKGLY